jgi:hypothetical protein
MSLVYGSPTCLDDPVIEAILGIGSADGYSPAQRRQAIQKGLLSRPNTGLCDNVLVTAGTSHDQNSGGKGSRQA